MTPVLAFDIETIPDVAGIRKLHDLPADLSDNEVAEFAFQQRRAASGDEYSAQAFVAIHQRLQGGL